jgi:integrase
MWIIIDNRKHHATGCSEREIAAAERALASYIATKHEPKREEQDIKTIPVADVLSVFVEDRPDLYIENAFARRYIARMERIKDFFGALMLSDINRKKTNEYVKKRGGKGGARRDLEDLRAAIVHHADEGFHRGIVKVKLPKKGGPRDRWLTRGEAAKLLWKCWRAKEVQTWNGVEVVTNKRPLRHVARFILIGLYSGSRAGAIAAASPIPAIGRSYVDLENGIFHRLSQGKEETNKRQPSARIAPRLLTHMRRWHRLKLIARHFVEWNGEGVKSVKTGFKTAVGLAQLGPNVSPHTLRHTAATWLMQNRADPWQAAGYLGMSLETLLKTYGHHHPDHQKDAVDKIAARPAKPADRANQRPIIGGEQARTNVIKIQ